MNTTNTPTEERAKPSTGVLTLASLEDWRDLKIPCEMPVEININGNAVQIGIAKVFKSGSDTLKADIYLDIIGSAMTKYCQIDLSITLGK